MSADKRKRFKKKKKNRLSRSQKAGIIILIAVLIVGGICGIFWRHIAEQAAVLQAKREIKNGKNLYAINYYRDALKYNPSDDEVYLALTDLYLAENNETYNPVISLILETGYERTGSAQIADRINTLGRQQQTDSDVESAVLGECPIKEATPGLPVKIIVTDSKDKQIISKYTYENDKPVAIEKNNENGEFIGRVEYVYDENGNLSENRDYDLRYQVSFEYDENLHLLCEKGRYYDGTASNAHIASINNDGSVTMRHDGSYEVDYSYDDNGNILTAVIIRNGEAYEIKNKYDRENHLISQEFEDTICKYTYEKGLVSTINYETGKENRKTITYTYDNAGNVLTETMLAETKVEKETVDSRNRKKKVEEWIQTDNYSESYYYNEGKLDTILHYMNDEFVWSKTYRNDGTLVLNEVMYDLSGVSASSKVCEYDYNSLGQATSAYEYYPGTDKELQIVTEYNASTGRKQSVLKKYYGSWDTSVNKDSYVAYTYLDNGCVGDEKEYYIVSDSVEIDKREERESGYVIWSHEKDSVGNITGSYYDEYNNDGLLVSRAKLDESTGNMTEYIEYCYDEWGYLIGETFYNSAGLISKVYTKTKDENGLFVSYNSEYTNKSLTLEEYKYDSEGRLVSLRNKKENKTYDYSYDSVGRLKKVTCKDSRGAVEKTTQYEY